MEWEYWNQEEADIIYALKLEERKLRIILARYFPDEEKKLRIIYCYFPSGVKVMGYAYTNEGIIRINKHFLFRVSMEENVDTLRHEFAHFFSFYEVGEVWIKRNDKCVYWPHNKNWKKWCRHLGCKPYAIGKNKCAERLSCD